MSQHDLDIANQGFPATRADLNLALKALGSSNSGASAPSTTYANQLWYDTANNILKIRNEDNDAWISLFTLDQTNDNIEALTVNGTLTATGAFTSPGIDDNADANAITIDSSEKVGIGDTSPLGNKVHIRTAGSATSVNGDAGLVLESDDSTRCDLQFMGPDGAFQSIYFGDVSDDNRGIIAYSHGGNNMRFTVDASERMRLTSDGLTFNGDTAAANALSDYEEGSCSGLGVETGTASFGLARYTKIGNLVNVKFYVDTFSDRTSANSVKVTGLPFTSAASHGDTVGSVLGRYVTAGDSGNVMANIGSSATSLFFYGTNDGGNWDSVSHSELNNSSTALYVNITYETP